MGRRFTRLAGMVGCALALQSPAMAQTPAPKVAQPAKAESPLVAEMKEAGAKYAEAFNKKDFKALGDQWTEQAELNEVGKSLKGREQIVQFIRGAFVRAPEGQMELKVDQVRPLGTGAAWVGGSIKVRESKDGRWFTSRFESLRVKEDGVWRVAVSSVVPVPEANLEDLSWLVGKWKAESSDGNEKGQVVEAAFQKMLGGQLLVAHLKRQPKDGPLVEAIHLFQADKHEGVLRTWVFESTGGRAEGIVESDGHTLNSVLMGRPASPEVGSRVGSVQVLTPMSKDEFLWQPIERYVDGVRLSDQKPLIFKRQS